MSNPRQEGPSTGLVAAAVLFLAFAAKDLFSEVTPGATGHYGGGGACGGGACGGCACGESHGGNDVDLGGLFAFLQRSLSLRTHQLLVSQCQQCHCTYI